MFHELSDTQIQVKQKMSIPTPRRGKSLESVQRQVSLRKSARKSIPEVSVKTPERGMTAQTPEMTFKTPTRIVPKSMRLNKSSKESKYKNSGNFSISNILDTKKEERVCSFYRKTVGPNGGIKFSPSLIKYFMKIDSPESEDLRFKRFNTSFRRERPTNRDSLKIFTEEPNDETESIKKNAHIPSPGSEHANVFASLPDIDFDFDLKQGKNKRKSVRCTPFKGPLPDEHLLFDYSPIFYSESDWEKAENGHKEKVEGVENISISGAFVNSPSDRPMTRNNSNNLLLTKEGESKCKVKNNSRVLEKKKKKDQC